MLLLKIMQWRTVDGSNHNSLLFVTEFLHMEVSEGYQGSPIKKELFFD